jgi:hypothetical protein
VTARVPILFPGSGVLRFNRPVKREQVASNQLELAAGTFLGSFLLFRKKNVLEHARRQPVP